MRLLSAIGEPITHDAGIAVNASSSGRNGEGEERSESSFIGLRKGLKWVSYKQEVVLRRAHRRREPTEKKGMLQWTMKTQEQSTQGVYISGM